MLCFAVQEDLCKPMRSGPCHIHHCFPGAWQIILCFLSVEHSFSHIFFYNKLVGYSEMESLFSFSIVRSLSHSASCSM